MVGSNYTQELQRPRPDDAWRDPEGVGLQSRHRRARSRRIACGIYLNLREEGSERTVPGMFANANAGDPTKWTYVADTSRPAVLAASYRITALRLTAQATPRNKFTRVLRPAAPLRRRCRAWILGRAPAASRATTRSSLDRRPPRRHRRPPSRRQRRRATAITATACRRRSGRRR